MTTTSSPLTSLRSTASYGAVRVLRALLLLLGLERASAFMGWTWQTLAPLTKRHPRAIAQLHAAMPELSGKDRKRIARAMWHGLGQTFAEGLLLDKLAQQPDRVVVEDEAMVASLTAGRGQNQGTVFVSMHAGNWEALGIPLARNGLHVAGLYQVVQNARLEHFLLGQRQQLYAAGMITKGSNAMKRIVGLLKAGDAVAMLADQRQQKRGILVPFFGAGAPSTPLPASLALRTGARLIACRCKRVGLVRYAIELKELDVVSTGDHGSDVERVTAAIHAQFETWIRERPHEWMWAHRRWSREVRDH